MCTCKDFYQNQNLQNTVRQPSITCHKLFSESLGAGYNVAYVDSVRPIFDGS